MPHPRPTAPTPAQVVTLASGAPLHLYRVAGAGRDAGAVVVLPGGGYRTLAPHEAGPIALWLNACGVHAAVCYYRHAPEHHHPAPLEDALESVRRVREALADRVGVLGFSAGGHLAATVSTHRHADPATRPDAAVLCYAVTSLTDAFAHGGSRANLLGDAHDAALARSLDAHRNVTADTPPTFLFHTTGDRVVPVDHALAYAAACRAAGVRYALHVSDFGGGHGVGLAADHPGVAAWAGHCAAWLRDHGFGGGT